LAILLSIAEKAGFPGIPLALILVSWHFKYAYVLFDHVVRGVDEPPALDINMVNPVNEQRPIAQVIILAAVAALVKLTASALSPAAGTVLAALALFFFPASVAILGLEGNMLKAVYPVALVRMVAGAGGHVRGGAQPHRRRRSGLGGCGAALALDAGANRRRHVRGSLYLQRPRRRPV